ncbi:hypothetical protein GCM10010341_36150 [Streptomyces noursei]|nr:hypothetical protein GCM10010341_36150 [Streptomyces noursei]
MGGGGDRLVDQDGPVRRQAERGDAAVFHAGFRDGGLHGGEAGLAGAEVLADGPVDVGPGGRSATQAAKVTFSPRLALTITQFAESSSGTSWLSQKTEVSAFSGSVSTTSTDSTGPPASPAAAAACPAGPSGSPGTPSAPRPAAAPLTR